MSNPEVYTHVKTPDRLYQVIGRGKVVAHPGAKFRDNGKVVAYTEPVNDTLLVVPFDPSPEQDTSPPPDAVVARLQIDTGTKLKDGEAVVLYRDMDAKYWVRPQAEFEDGRFKKVEAEGSPVEPMQFAPMAEQGSTFTELNASEAVVSVPVKVVVMDEVDKTEGGQDQ